MDLSGFTDPEGALMQPWQGDAAVLVEAVSSQADVKWVRGSHMRTRQALMDEWAAAAQFSPHFGNNWDALRDALSDLPEGGVFLVLEADQLLQEAPPRDAEILVSVLKAVRADLHPKPFGVVMQAEPEAYETLMKRWRALGVM